MKKTKIVATISDIRCDVEFLEKLYNAGVNVMRLNTAHQNLESSKKVVENIRKVSNKIAIIIDTKGPEVRIMDLEKSIEVKVGDIVKFGSVKVEGANDIVYVNYEGFVSDVPEGASIFLDDAKVELKVKGKEDGFLLCEVLNEGAIKNKKSVNVPNVPLNYPSLIPKDVEYIEYAAKNDIDYIAHSFVRHREDVMGVKNLIEKFGGKTKIIVKIENQEGVDNIEEILDEAHAVMVARGDLAVEVPAEKVPFVQRELIKTCIKRRRPVIVATQMMQSMCDSPRPTRAEVSDVAGAIRLGTDAIMTSDETTMGKYPVETIKMMTKIALEVEKESEGLNKLAVHTVDDKVVSFLTKAAARASMNLPVKAILCDSDAGRTAKYLAAFRGDKLIFAECYNDMIMRQLALSYGVYASRIKKADRHDAFIKTSLKNLLEETELNAEDLIVVLAGNYGVGDGASILEINTIENLMDDTKKVVKC